MAYSKQTWDASSYVNPTRMNHIEDGIESASTATGTEYSSGVSVKDKIDAMNTWTSLGDITSGGDGVDVSQYSTICILPKMQGWATQNPQFIPKLPNTANAVAVYVNASYYFSFRINFSPSGVLSIDNEALSGWTSCVYGIFAQ